MVSSSPSFGKRNAARATPLSGSGVDLARVDGAPSQDHAAFFAAVRADFDSVPDRRARVVPRSGKAAFITGLVTGCALAGFNVRSGAGGGELAVAAGLVGIDSTRLVPMSIALGLLGGARATATMLFLVQTGLAAAGLTTRSAYAAGGAAGSLVVAAALLLGFGHAPAHGWLVEALAGAGSGFVYRAFAGSRAA